MAKIVEVDYSLTHEEIVFSGSPATPDNVGSLVVFRKSSFYDAARYIVSLRKYGNVVKMAPGAVLSPRRLQFLNNLITAADRWTAGEKIGY